MQSSNIWNRTIHIVFTAASLLPVSHRFYAHLTGREGFGFPTRWCYENSKCVHLRNGGRWIKSSVTSAALYANMFLLSGFGCKRSIRNYLTEQGLRGDSQKAFCLLGRINKFWAQEIYCSYERAVMLSPICSSFQLTNEIHNIESGDPEIMIINLEKPWWVKNSAQFWHAFFSWN